MKKRICLALGALVIAMSIFSPMLVWAEPEGENPGGSTEPPVVEPTEPVTPTTPDTKPEKPKNNNSNKNNNKNNSSRKNNGSSQNRDNQNNDSNNEQQQTPADTEVNEPEAESSIEKGVASIIFTDDMHSHPESETVVRQLLSRKYHRITKTTALYSTVVISPWEAHIRQYLRGMLQSLE